MKRAPIKIYEYNNQWPERYETYKQEILEKTSKYILTIHHVGSTSVPGLGSKDIIDIMIGVEYLDIANNHVIPSLEELGYEYIPRHEKTMPFRRFLALGSREKGRDAHIHIYQINHEEYTRHLLFRNYLRDFPETRDQYYQLKKELEHRFKLDRGAYTDAKSEFIETIISKAQTHYDQNN